MLIQDQKNLFKNYVERDSLIFRREREARQRRGALKVRRVNLLIISSNLVPSQTGMKPIPIDSSRRAEHEYTRDFGRNGTNKKVMGSQSLQIHKGGPFGRKGSKNYFLKKCLIMGNRGR